MHRYTENTWRHITHRAWRLIHLWCVVLLFGCAQTGSDGDSFIAYSWPVEAAISFVDFEHYKSTREDAFKEKYRDVVSDPAFTLLDEIENGRYLSAHAGRWGMAYAVDGGGGFWAVYEIYIEKVNRDNCSVTGATGAISISKSSAAPMARNRISMISR